MKLAFLCLTLSALAGCVPVPVPHSSVNAPRFSGRVVSAATRRPVSGAQVVLRGLDDSATQTDAGGRFLTGISRTMHLAGLYTYDEGMRLQFPPARRGDGTLLVTHPGYAPAQVPVDCSAYPQPFQSDRQVIVVPLADVFLRPDLR